MSSPWWRFFPLPALLTACSAILGVEDYKIVDAQGNPGGDGGSGGSGGEATGGQGAGAGQAGVAGEGGASGSGGGATGGDGGTAGQGGEAGQGGAGGATGGTAGGGTAGAPGDPCNPPKKQIIEVSSSIDGNDTWQCSRLYRIIGSLKISEGSSLTIEPGTTIEVDATSSTPLFLVVEPGGILNATGTKERPILFTSSAPLASKAPGQWGGIVLLGKARTNLAAGKNKIPGLGESPGVFGGEDDGDTSGTLKYVRIEYAGKTGSSAGALTLAGVGSGTTLDFLQVRQSQTDAFVFLGGTASARHLVTQGPGRSSFRWYGGYRGSLQFLLAQQSQSASGEAHGLEGGSVGVPEGPPFSEPKIANVTLCGANKNPPGDQLGLLIQAESRGVFSNLIVTGFEVGLDVRGTSGPTLSLTQSVFFNNLVANVAAVESGGADDDGGFDEQVELFQKGVNNSTVDPQLKAPFSLNAPDFRPATQIVKSPPPAGGFLDASANYAGAFKNEVDDWASGWTSWSAQ